MGVVLIDGQEVEIAADERFNGIQAARRAGVEIPHYCWHPGLSVVASCRMCLVETGSVDPQSGDVAMVPKLVPACQTPARDGTVFVTDSEKVRHARAFVEECLLIDHPIDCPICDKAGECQLQDYHFEHGQESRRADVRPFTSRRRDVGDSVTLFVDRCVMCSRCVRFTREITGTSELMVTDRGSHEEIDVVPGFPLDNKMSGNVVDLCPVGALGDKDFLYQQRVWFMNRQAGVCTRCSTGCSIWIEENQNHVYRIKPRENLHINEWWICDEGRYGYHHVHDSRRVVGAEFRVQDGYAPVEWSEVPELLEQRFGDVERAAVVISPQLAVEEAYLLALWMRKTVSEARLFLGPVPTHGEDQTFPNRFTIRAEKCPNRRGVEEVIRHIEGEVPGFEVLLEELSEGQQQAAWVTGAYPETWIDESSAAAFDKVDMLVVQDMFASPLWERADVRLPGASFAEREGSYVNHSDRLQWANWAVRPPAGVWIEGALYWWLLQRPGLYRPKDVLEELSREIPFFAAASDFGETGVQLGTGQSIAKGSRV